MAEISPKETTVSEITDNIELMSSDHYENSEVNEVLKGLVNHVSEEMIHKNENDAMLRAISPTDISNFVIMEESDSTIQNNDLFEKDKIEYFSKQQKIATKKRRSISGNESETVLKTKEIIRRKFGSEGAILSTVEKILPLERRKELNEAIERYVEKLINESISKAVKSVSVNSICEDIIQDLSNRNNSLSEESEEDFIVEQRLTSDSISELVELENAGDDRRTDCRDSLLPSYDAGSETESLQNELDDVEQASFKGYLADLEDTASVDDLKSAEESLNSSNSSNLEQKFISLTDNQESFEKSCEEVNQTEATQNTMNDKAISKDTEIVNEGTADNVTQPKEKETCHSTENISEQQQKVSSTEENISEQKQTLTSTESIKEPKQNLDPTQQEQKVPSEKSTYEQEQKSSSAESFHKPEESLSPVENNEKQDQKLISSENFNETADLIIMSPEGEFLLPKNDSKNEENPIPSPDIIDTLPQQKVSVEEQMKVNWKVGYLQVKLPHKTRGKTHLKAWKKRRVIIQPDEFVNDPKNPGLVISVYGADSKKHETTFWHSVSSLKAVVFRSSSRTHRYAFTISDEGEPIIHLSSENESTTQEWMAAIRTVLWPPSPFMELEKMLSGREFEISIIDNEFSYHAGLLGMYGYLSITPKKLILLHPQQGYVIQEWYLNTVDKFQLVHQPKADDVHKVLCMTTCSDSSTGRGEIILFCNEAVTLLQSLASNIHQVLSYHSKQEGGKYLKELEEIAEWLVAPPQDCLNVKAESNEHYKVPPRQVKSLLDIPNFIFNKSLSPVASAIYPAPNSDPLETLDATKSKPTTTSHDSGISTCTSNEDFLNCSLTSFVIGGGPMTEKSSDSELSDSYTPPRTPEINKKAACEVLKEEQTPEVEA